MPHVSSVTKWLGPAFALAATFLAACSERQVTAPALETPLPPPRVVAALDCTARTAPAAVTCTTRRAGGRGSALRVLGGPYANISLGSASYDPATGIYQVNAAIRNQMNEAIGTPDGTQVTPEGVWAFFHDDPIVTAGTGSVGVIPDGYTSITAVNQAYYAYHQIVAGHDSSAARTWTFVMPSTVQSFDFVVLVAAETQYLLVINEFMANPGGTISDANGEWIEVYNAGSLPVSLQGLLVSDSASTGRRPYHAVGTVYLAPGGYTVLGATADTTLNGGVPVVHAYGSALALDNSADAIKLSRVYGTDTLTIDRVAYRNGSVSAQNGISRELINPLLNNAKPDGNTWANASTTAVYGSGGRGTPGAQNSAYVP